MTRLLLIGRHAENDEDGNLTPRGIQQARSVAEQVAGLYGVPDIFKHSSVPRAVQTMAVIQPVFARAAGRSLSSTQDILLSDDYLNHGPKVLGKLSPTANLIFLVTHQPNARALTKYLTNRDFLPKLPVHGEVLVIETEGPCWDAPLGACFQTSIRPRV